jgi:hypothetical protein
MPPSSKVITMLPPHIRQEVERRMFENGFRDYEGLAQWVRGQGYEISEDSLWRYGYKLKQQFVETKWTMLQMRALSELGVTDQDMEKALLRVAQTKALATLADMEEVKAGDLNARTNLIKTIMTQYQRAEESRARCQQQKQKAAQRRSGPAATALDLPHDAPSAPSPVQQSPATGVGASAVPEHHNGNVVAKPNDERPLAGCGTEKISSALARVLVTEGEAGCEDLFGSLLAAELPPRPIAVPPAGGPLPESNSARTTGGETRSHHATPRNLAQLAVTETAAGSFVGRARQPVVLSPNSAATVVIRGTAHLAVAQTTECLV